MERRISLSNCDETRCAETWAQIHYPHYVQKLVHKYITDFRKTGSYKNMKENFGENLWPCLWPWVTDRYNIKSRLHKRQKWIHQTSSKWKAFAPWKILLKDEKTIPQRQKTFAHHIYDKRAVSKSYKELSDSRTGKKKKATRNVTKKEIQMANKKSGPVVPSRRAMSPGP
jgi:hypothetical protein